MYLDIMYSVFVDIVWKSFLARVAKDKQFFSFRISLPLECCRTWKT